MSREELADTANRALAQRHEHEARVGRWGGLTARHIGAYERGETRWPNRDYRWALCTVLAAGETDLGFYIDRPERNDHEPRRVEAGLLDGLSTRPDQRWLPGRPGTMPAVTPCSGLPDVLRAQLSSGVDPSHDGHPAQLDELARIAGAAHRAYQQAHYRQAADAVAAVLAHVAGYLAGNGERIPRRAHAIQAVANILASKLASKAGEGELAWIAADRASAAACMLGDATLRGAAAYQIACALGQLPGRLGDAQDTISAGLQRLGREEGSPKALSVRGALELQGAINAAKLGNPAQARQHLAAAAGLAEKLGTDGNQLWTAFGPTNVRLHEVAVEIGLHRFTTAIHLGEEIDTSTLPTGLVGRRAQIHVDLANAWTQTDRDDRQALLHLLEAERLATEIVQFNHAARNTAAALLHRTSGPPIPGLRALAQRAGVGA